MQLQQRFATAIWKLVQLPLVTVKVGQRGPADLLAQRCHVVRRLHAAKFVDLVDLRRNDCQRVHKGLQVVGLQDGRLDPVLLTKKVRVKGHSGCKGD